MPSFKDAKDREWNLSIDAKSIMRIREECDPDFLKNDFSDGQENTYARLQADPVLLCRVLYLLCEKQRREQQVSEEEFYMEVIGTAIDRASEAMLQAIVFFIPSGQRKLMEVFTGQDKIRQQAISKAVEKATDPALQEELTRMIGDRIDGEYQEILTRLSSATKLPESSESVPTA